MPDILDELKQLSDDVKTLEAPKGKKKTVSAKKPKPEKKGKSNSKPAPTKAASGRKLAKVKEKASKKIEKPSKKIEKPAKKERKVSTGITRVHDRDRSGDGLREVERKLIKVVEKHGPISIKNLAEKMFGKDVPGEAAGADSVRTVRNAVRKPIEYGLLQRPNSGAIEVTSAYKKHGTTVAEKAVAAARAARTAGGSRREVKTASPKERAKKSAKAKKAKNK